MKNKLLKLTHTFLNESLKIIINKNYETLTFIEFEVLQRKNGFYFDSKKTVKTDFKKIVNDSWDEIKSSSEFKICKNFLKIILQKQYQKNHIQNELEQINLQTEKELREFLIYFLNHHQKLSLSTSVFNKLFNDFYKYLENEFGAYFCFATVLNLDGTFREINFKNESHIRKITPNEFSVISGIKGKSEKQQVDPSLLKIKYVITCRVQYNNLKEKIFLSIFNTTINGFRVFQQGDVKLGGIYFSESEHYTVKPIKNLRSEPKIPFSSPYKLNSSSKICNFKKFYDSLTAQNLTKGKYSFINRAITRFSKSLDDNQIEDFFLDNVICLESMYSSKESEISFKFSLRIAGLLGRNSNEKQKLQKLMYHIYDLRSRIVHGDEVPEIIGDDEYSIEKDSAMYVLEEISRNSIKIFLTMIKNFNNYSSIQKEIQNSIYDAKSKQIISKYKQKTPFAEFSFMKTL